MLIEFRVKNFRSFREDTVLSMVASSDKDTLPENVIESENGTKLRLLKSAVIYGANASGKSNLIKAMSFMRTFVLESDQGDPDSIVNHQPFLFDELSASTPSEFEVDFYYNNIRHVYGFSVDKHTVHSEWLYSYPKQKQTLLFERKASISNRDEYRFNRYFFKKGESDKIASLVRKNGLFISIASKLNCVPAKTIKKWFESQFETFKSDGIFEFYKSVISKVMFEDVEYRNEMCDFIKKGDINISNVKVNKNTPNGEEQEFFDKQIAKVGNILSQMLETKDGIFDKPSGRVYEEYSITILHKYLKSNGEIDEVALDISEESQGTKKLFVIFVNLFIRMYSENTLFVDELDIKLHPLLLEWIIKYFNKHSTKSQLIFTSHNTELLYPDIFRRDQIWFTAKDHDTKGSELYSLSDFKHKRARKDENFRKNYLEGRYGAIPILERFD